jgi:hypothetical protein
MKPHTAYRLAHYEAIVAAAPNAAPEYTALRQSSTLLRHSLTQLLYALPRYGFSLPRRIDMSGLSAEFGIWFELTDSR